MKRKGEEKFFRSRPTDVVATENNASFFPLTIHLELFRLKHSLFVILLSNLITYANKDVKKYTSIKYEYGRIGVTERRRETTFDAVENLLNNTTKSSPVFSTNLFFRRMRKVKKMSDYLIERLIFPFATALFHQIFLLKFDFSIKSATKSLLSHHVATRFE